MSDTNTASVSLRPVSLATDLDRCYDIEAASYPADEAASKESLTYRFDKASSLSYVAVLEGTGDIVGFVCGTTTKGSELTDESMEVGGHDADGESICIQNFRP